MIITSRSKFGGNKKMIRALARKSGARLPVDLEPQGDPVVARINFGRWLADCDRCGGAELVDPLDPIFFCFSCHNVDNGGATRPVTFPGELEEIETEIEKRKGKRVGDFFQPGLGQLPQEWTPGETVEDLREQRKRGSK